MKRLYIAASVALTTLLLAAQSSADALTPRAISSEHKVPPLAQKIATQAKGVAASMSSVGYCYRGVKRALKKVGVGLEGSSAFMAKRQLEQDRRFNKVPMNNLKKGDILVHGKSGAHPHGHIAVYLGNGKEASDHIGKLVTGRRYGGTSVFRAKGAGTQIASAKSKSSARVIATDPKVKKNTIVARAPKENAKVLVASATAVNQAAVDRAVNVARARMQQQEAIAHAVRVAKPMAPKAPTFDLTAALARVLPVVQNAQINLTAALANAVPEVMTPGINALLDQ